MAFHVAGIAAALIGVVMMVLGAWEKAYPTAVPTALLALALLAATLMFVGVYIDNLAG
jgi:hypothetical protein